MALESMGATHREHWRLADGPFGATVEAECDGSLFRIKKPDGFRRNAQAALQSMLGSEYQSDPQLELVLSREEALALVVLIQRLTLGNKVQNVDR